VSKAIVVLVAALLLATTPGTASAAPTPRTSLNAVEAEVMCVSCGVPLAIAESPQADAERKDITNLIKQGKTKDEIKTELVATYGDRVLALPKDSGFGLVSYLVPIAIALLAIGAGLVFVPRWRRTRGGDDDLLADAGPALSAADTHRLDEDLARYGR
jgi:cytochrome c-type biogenesis protein CcmH